MGYNKWKTSAIAAALTFLALFGGMGCMISGMKLSVELPLFIAGCVVMSAAFSFCFNTRLWLLPICMAALLMGYWWQEGSLRLSMEGLIYQVTDLYDRGYGWGILQWTDRNLLSRDVTPALLALALPIAGVVSLTVVKGRLGWLGAGAALLPLLCTVLLKDTVPSESYLGLLLFALVLILMSEGVRKKSHQQSNRLVLTLTLPLALALTVLFVLVPKDSYNGQAGAQKLEDFVLSVLNRSQVPDSLQAPALVPGDQSQTVQLENVGKRSNNSKVVMTVQAQESGVIYLRGCAYDVYDGTSWSCTPGWNSWNLYYSASGSTVKSLTVETKSIHSVLYFTYAPYNAEQKVVGGRMRNEQKLRNYTIYYRDPFTYSEELDLREDAVGGDQLEEYLALPDSTRQRAQQILSKKVGVPTHTINAGQVWRNAAYIVDWVSHRADYDLKTGKMPASEDDFALWFLEKSDTGYCTHFATAAVVLLRAAGIPAQYVTGYLVETKADQRVSVTSDNAHAWVEVFINGVGWVPLEPTPAQGLTPPTGDLTEPSIPHRPTNPVDATTPGVTTAPTAPEQTGQATEPEQTTVPSTATSPTGATTEPFSYPTQVVTGVAGIGGTTPGTPAQQSLSTALLWLVGYTAALTVLTLQWRLRVWLLRHSLRSGKPNSRAIKLWRQLERMGRLLKQPPEEDLYWLAQKARFSQHTITEQELQAMHAALQKSYACLQKKHFAWQLVYTLILAIY